MLIFRESNKNNTTLFVPNMLQLKQTTSINKNMEEYQMPQITIGARKKGQLYLGDLSNVMIWVNI